MMKLLDTFLNALPEDSGALRSEDNVLSFDVFKSNMLIQFENLLDPLL